MFIGITSLLGMSVHRLQALYTRREDVQWKVSGAERCLREYFIYRNMQGLNYATQAEQVQEGRGQKTVRQPIPKVLLHAPT
jgi:hypothetical protein